jgi:hypothetical protein
MHWKNLIIGAFSLAEPGCFSIQRACPLPALPAMPYDRPRRREGRRKHGQEAAT